MDSLRAILNAYNVGSFIINSHGSLSGGTYSVDSDFHFITVAPLGEGAPDTQERMLREFNSKPEMILDILNHDTQLGPFYQVRHHPAGTNMNDLNLQFRPFFGVQRVPLGIRTFPLPASFTDRVSMSVENPYEGAIMFSNEDYKVLNGKTILLSQLVPLLKKNKVPGGVFVVWTCRSCPDPELDGDEQEVSLRPMRQVSASTDVKMSGIISKFLQLKDEGKLNQKEIIQNAIQNGIIYSQGPLPPSILSDSKIQEIKRGDVEEQEQIEAEIARLLGRLYLSKSVKKEKLPGDFKCTSKKRAEEILSTRENGNIAIQNILTIYHNSDLSSINKLKELKKLMSTIKSYQITSLESLINKCESLSTYIYALINIAKSINSYSWFEMVSEENDEIEEIVDEIEEKEVIKYKNKYMRYYIKY
ncbi:hypothetical protein CPAV1605_845 [seawater metagenome]|uniref:Uncharacterized protein n=1 Tax=seawater metagenome TaxID=1561972 RepID=A0A5E8CMD6_9ZZZZ